MCGWLGSRGLLLRCLALLAVAVVVDKVGAHVAVGVGAAPDVTKRVVANVHRGAWHVHSRQFRAAVEGTVTDAGEARREGDGVQAGAALRPPSSPIARASV